MTETEWRQLSSNLLLQLETHQSPVLIKLFKKNKHILNAQILDDMQHDPVDLTLDLLYQDKLLGVKKS